MEGELRVTCDNSDKLWYLDSHVKFYIWKNSSSLVIGRDALDQSDCRLYGSWKYNISQMHLKNSKLVGIGVKCLKITIPKYLKMIWYLKKKWIDNTDLVMISVDLALKVLKKDMVKLSLYIGLH